MEFKNKTALITGASRGIGLAIAKRLAQSGANIVIAAKSTEPNPKLPGTIYTAADEIRRLGGRALPLIVDVRSEEHVAQAVEKTIREFGGIDILVNNASAIFLAGTLDTPMKRFDLMHQVNARATYLCSKMALPHLLKAKDPHILVLAPPLNLNPKWFKNHTAYTIAKYGMSMCVVGMAAEFRSKGVAVNALWPKTPIATSAIRNLTGGEALCQASRIPEIMGDAAHIILSSRGCTITGQFFIDEEVLRTQGVVDFDKYAVDPSMTLLPDLFLD